MYKHLLKAFKDYLRYIIIKWFIDIKRKHTTTRWTWTQNGQNKQRPPEFSTRSPSITPN